MRMRFAAFAACVVASVVAWPAAATLPVDTPPTLTLDDAFARVADYQGKQHPDLRLFGTRADVLAAERDAIAAEAAALQEAAATAATQAAEAEATALQAIAAAESAAAAALARAAAEAALGQVQAAVASGAAFAAPLATVAATIEIPDALQAVAEAGVPTQDALTRGFAPLARAALPVAL